MSDLTPGAKVLKYLILLFNFIFFICGIALICIGAAVSIKFKFPAHFIKNGGADFTHALGSAPIGCVIAGIIIISIVLFGCVGAYKEGSCLIGLFASLLVICCFIEFGSAAAIASWKKIDGEADNKIKQSFTDLIQKYTPDSPVTTKPIDTIQIVLECCGNAEAKDWRNNQLLNPAGNLTDIVTFPKSCCGWKEDNGAICNSDQVVFHHDGCAEKAKNMIESNASIIIGAGVTIGLLQILGVIFSCMLIRKIRASTGYEPQFNSYG